MEKQENSVLVDYLTLKHQLEDILIVSDMSLDGSDLDAANATLSVINTFLHSIADEHNKKISTYLED
ncbi:hypothetical protein AT575_06020 [Streptococcus penaeicida]|uniref:Uncharacterized protein n=1 Tax=Streptococcus penaeicida TaxID=1765960 RepID=A0A2N8LBD7_9STRE|nr:hypothetical protein [Streptococcus penaeicida]PND47462.1 hypothetical protein AT575_06020 [Streptococcus penaeicida]